MNSIKFFMERSVIYCQWHLGKWILLNFILLEVINIRIIFLDDSKEWRNEVHYLVKYSLSRQMNNTIIWDHSSEILVTFYQTTYHHTSEEVFFIVTLPR